MVKCKSASQLPPPLTPLHVLLRGSCKSNIRMSSIVKRLQVLQHYQLVTLGAHANRQIVPQLLIPKNIVIGSGESGVQGAGFLVARLNAVNLQERLQ